MFEPHHCLPQWITHPLPLLKRFHQNICPWLYPQIDVVQWKWVQKKCHFRCGVNIIIGPDAVFTQYQLTAHHKGRTHFLPPYLYLYHCCPGIPQFPLCPSHPPLCGWPLQQNIARPSDASYRRSYFITCLIFQCTLLQKESSFWGSKKVQADKMLAMTEDFWCSPHALPSNTPQAIMPTPHLTKHTTSSTSQKFKNS